MPERIHHRFDTSEPAEVADINTKKRKRVQQNGPISKDVTLNRTYRSQSQSNPHQRYGEADSRPSKVRSKSEGPTAKENDEYSETLGKRANGLLDVRKTLPIWSKRVELCRKLKDKDVLLLVGETGSGKSTQVPQFLMYQDWRNPKSVTLSDSPGRRNVLIGGCIAITEPRKVAAISLAKRVAAEMGVTVGSKVGYSVRFDNCTGPATIIKFLTEGMLLQEMLRDPWLKAYSAVIVDEVHERTVNVDLVLGFLRQMLAGKNEGRAGIPLKVVAMSATAEMDKLNSFFDCSLVQASDSTESTRGVASPDQPGKVADASESEWSGIATSEDEQGGNHPKKSSTGLANGNKTSTKRAPNGHTSEDEQDMILPGKSTTEVQTNGTKASPPKAINGHKHKNDETAVPVMSNDDANDTSKESALLNGHRETQAETGESPNVATCYIEGRQHHVTVNYAIQATEDFSNASLRTIFQINRKEPLPGDILVFLTGQEMVETLVSQVKEYAKGVSSDEPGIQVMPLYAALSDAEQQKVFQPTRPKIRKIIVATNIAETSVTVPGVRFVVDCGKAKIKQYRSRIGLESLLVKSISRSAAIQRKGRAGREAEGHCYRLYSESEYLKMDQSTTPEILRCDLSNAILMMKATGVHDLINFPYLDSPSREALERAILHIYHLGAISRVGDITEIGQQMAKSPLPTSLGRVLVEAAVSSQAYISEVIDIISCLAVEDSIFLNLTSEEKRQEADDARRDLYRREGDHLTLLTTVQAYAAENVDRLAWAKRHFVSHRAIQSIMKVRKQLRNQYKVNGDGATTVTSEGASSILKCFLKGFSSNTARVLPGGGYKTFTGNQTVKIHPSSSLQGRSVEAIMFDKYIYTTKAYARGVSAVQVDWIDEVFRR